MLTEEELRERVKIVDKLIETMDKLIETMDKLRDSIETLTAAVGN
jgi:hypothetical protein